MNDSQKGGLYTPINWHHFRSLAPKQAHDICMVWHDRCDGWPLVVHACTHVGQPLRHLVIYQPPCEYAVSGSVYMASYICVEAYWLYGYGYTRTIMAIRGRLWPYADDLTIYLRFRYGFGYMAICMGHSCMLAHCMLAVAHWAIHWSMILGYLDPSRATLHGVPRDHPTSSPLHRVPRDQDRQHIASSI